eukprot:5811973-Alexandrium_andersonii.AAC.1
MEAQQPLWPLKPKLHQISHLLLEIQKERINPRFYHTFADEDFIGCIVRVARKCPRAALARRCLQRYLVRVALRWSRRGTPANLRGERDMSGILGRQLHAYLNKGASSAQHFGILEPLIRDCLTAVCCGGCWRSLLSGSLGTCGVDLAPTAAARRRWGKVGVAGPGDSLRSERQHPPHHSLDCVLLWQWRVSQSVVCGSD